MDELAFGQSVRLSLLLFDKIVAETDHEDQIERLLHATIKEGKLAPRGRRMLLDILVPISRLVRNFNTSDLMRSPEDTFLTLATEHVLDQEYITAGREPPDEAGPRFLHDVRYRVTIAGFENWFALSRQRPCVFIPNDYEDPILQEFTKFVSYPRGQASENVCNPFETVVTKLLPRIETISLDQILAFRAHDYFTSFRDKAKILIDRSRCVEHPDEVVRLIAEEEQRDLRCLQDMFRPHPFKAAIRAIIGSLPFPFIPNPVGLYDSIRAVGQEYRAAKQLGWLYVIRDFKDKLSP